MTLIEEIMEYLEEEIAELEIGDNLVMGSLPSTPQKCAAIRPTGGFAGDMKFALDIPTFQVTTRSDKDRRTGYTLAQEIYDVMHNFRHGRFVEDGRWIVEVSGVQSGPNAIGRDDNNRERYTCNFTVEYKNENSDLRE